MLSYQDFCELCEERIREIDPFDNIVQKDKEIQTQRQHLESHHGLIHPIQNPKDPTWEDAKYSSYQTDFKTSATTKQMAATGFDFKDLGIIDEIEENINNPRRMTYDTSTVKTKQRNKTLKSLKQQLIKNPQTSNQISSKGFGMTSEFSRPRIFEADTPGGEIGQIISS